MVLWNEKVKFVFKQLNYRAKEQMTFDHDALGLYKDLSVGKSWD